MIGVGMFNSTILYDSIVVVIIEGFPHFLEFSLPAWAALSIWIFNYAWACLTEIMSFQYGIFIALRCAIQWIFAMIGNFVWPVALAVMSSFFLVENSNLPTFVIELIPKVLGIGCLVFNFCYPQRKLNQLFGPYTV